MTPPEKARDPDTETGSGPRERPTPPPGRRHREPGGSGDGERTPGRREIRAVVEEVLDALAGDAPPGPEPASLHGLAVQAVRKALSDGMAGAPRPHGLDDHSRALLHEVAHLLRSPLGSVVMLAQVLLEGQSGPLTDLQRRQLHIIHRAMLAVASTVDSVLSLTEDEGVGRPAPFSVPEILERVGDIVRPVAQGRGSELSVVASSLDGQRIGPASGIGRALLGLAVPAALRTRGGTLTLRARGEAGDVVAFSVAAEGENAVPEDDGADPFHVLRVDALPAAGTLSTDRLGLAAAREILDAVGSELAIDTTAGGGFHAGFSLVLPSPERVEGAAPRPE